MSTAVAATTIVPTSEAEAAEAIRQAAAQHSTFRIVGGDTRSGLGRPTEADAVLSTRALTGITMYEPAELVLSARAGTPLVEIEAALAEHRQMLAFEPMDHRALYSTTGKPTIGGAAAVNASGPRRIKVGAARDAVLGVRFVNGNGEIIKSGGRVMKNVTGLDLVKLQCGAHGTLGLLTEITVKVLPRPETSATLVVEGLPDRDAITALSAAVASPFEPSGAAHLPNAGSGPPRTLVRLEGFAESVAHRSSALRERIEAWQTANTIDGPEAELLWRSIRDAGPLAEPRDAAIWRLSVRPSRAAAIVATIAAVMPSARWFYDWAGGLIWLAVDAEGDAGGAIVRSAYEPGEGHATLARAPEAVRLKVDVFEPLARPLATLTRETKRSFDPGRIFQPGRMYSEI